ncbi:MAG: hypothetical protein HeimC2_22750 [Candidatus Heimdallarchaeota archaeon LC_2]|nr:MAG: hypothetical protein HeimC2_22750 [Candidatus Heimdallarchaeota archaeon LC_2]
MMGVINLLMSSEAVDKVKRPDHYKCLNCGDHFNDAKFVKSQKKGIHSAIAGCPSCGSTKIKISWWKKKQ